MQYFHNYTVLSNWNDQLFIPAIFCPIMPLVPFTNFCLENSNILEDIDSWILGNPGSYVQVLGSPSAFGELVLILSLHYNISFCILNTCFHDQAVNTSKYLS